MRKDLINEEAVRLERIVNERAQESAKDLGVGSRAENAVYRQMAEQFLGDWDWTMVEGIGISPRVVILRYTGEVD